MDQKEMKFWQRVAKFYGPIQERTNKKLYRECVQLCLPYINKDKDVLELACGSGQFTKPLYKQARRWVASDFSQNMLYETKKCCQDVEVSLQDFTHLTLEEKSFDLVLIANALHLIPDASIALREVRKVLKDDGLLIAPTFVYEGKINRIRMWITTKVGFRCYHEWRFQEYIDFIEEQGFTVIQKELIGGDPLPEAFVVLQKK